MCGPIVYPPVITSIEPAEDCLIDTMDSFFLRQFELILDTPARITVFFNDVVAFATDVYETVISWIFDRNTFPLPIPPNPIPYIIRIVTTNDSGTNEHTYHQVITDTPITTAPQIINRTPDQNQILINLEGSGIRSFGVTTDQPATIIFSVDLEEKFRYNAVTEATWECDFSNYSTGTHSVGVTVVNSIGSDSITWSCQVIDELIISFVTPLTETVSNYDSNNKRLFRASINVPCLLKLFFDDRLIKITSSEATGISHEFDLVPLGSHTVKIVAEKDSIQVERSWYWDVTEYSDSDIIYCESRQYSGLRSLNRASGKIEKNLHFYSNLDIRCQKSQLPDGSWIYLFICSNIGMVVDDNLDFPPIVTNVSGYNVDAYLGGFNQIDLSLSETFGNENFVLLSSMDKFCVGVYPLKWGTLENYYKQHAELEFLINLMGFIPVLGNLINLVTLSAPGDISSETESINYSFPYEATMESNGQSPSGGRSPYVENQFRWIAWVQSGSNVKFSFMMKLTETNTVGEYFETNKEIHIAAGNDPVIL